MSEKNGNGGFGPWWVRAIGMVGVPSVIALGLLGFIPGVPSLAAQFQTETAEIKRDLRSNRRVQYQVLRTLRAICYRLPDSPRAPACEPGADASGFGHDE